MATLRSSVEQENNKVVLDLGYVFLINREAISLLVSYELNGTELRNCPAYIREWITQEATFNEERQTYED